MMKIALFACLALLACGAMSEISEVPTSDAVVGEDSFEESTAPSAPINTEEEVDEELIQASFDQASDDVTSLMEAGRSDKACRDMAKATCSEVTSSVAAQQKAVSNMPNGNQCDGEGQDLIRTAENNKRAADKAEKDALNKLNAAKSVKINFGDMTVSSLREGQCSSFYNSFVWTNAQTKIRNAKNTYNSKKASAKAAKTAVQTAKDTAAKMVRDCKCKSKSNIESAISKFNSASKSSNQAAWTKCHHMQCVLDGKTAASCRVPSLPIVKPVAFGKGVTKACGPTPMRVKRFNTNTGGRHNRRYFELVEFTASTGWTDNQAGMNKYIALCQQYGLKAVGCGTNSYDASPYGNAIAMPSNWGCNMMSQMSRSTGWGSNIFALQEKPGNNAALYSVSKHPTSSMNLHPVCGKHNHGYDINKYTKASNKEVAKLKTGHLGNGIYRFGEVGRGKWRLVRRVKAGNSWHPAKDQMRGTSEYGSYSTSITTQSTFSVKFDNWGCTQYLFATGDMKKWLVAPTSSVMGWYANGQREIYRSSTSATPYKARWYRRKSQPEDPWISLIDHGPAINKGDIVYGEAGYGGNHAGKVLPMHKGANVFCLVEKKIHEQDLSGLKCSLHTKGGNHAGVYKTKGPSGTTLTGGGMKNNHGGWDKLSAVEQFFPDGNSFNCDTGFGAGKLTCYGVYCKKAGKALTCQTKSKRVKNQSKTGTAHLSSGYVMTGGGLFNHYRHWNNKGQFEASRPVGSGWQSDMGFGAGDFTSYVRGCKGVSCVTVKSRVGDATKAVCPSGYTVTGCGMTLDGSLRKMGPLAAFEYTKPHSNLKQCDCNMGFGAGKDYCYARCCK